MVVCFHSSPEELVMSGVEIEEMAPDSALERQYTTLEAKNWLDN